MKARGKENKRPKGGNISNTFAQSDHTHSHTHTKILSPNNR